MGLEGHIIHMGEIESYKILGLSLKGRGYLVDLVVDGVMLLKFILEK
jgi:hypothetical protein